MKKFHKGEIYKNIKFIFTLLGQDFHLPGANWNKMSKQNTRIDHIKTSSRAITES